MKTKYAVMALLLAAPLPAVAAPGDAPPQGDHRGPDGRQGPGRGMPSPEKMFDMIDANHDGSITRAEFTAAHRRMMEHRGQRGPHGPGRPDGPSPQGAPRPR